MESSKKPENGVRGRAADMREHAGLRGPWPVESSLMIAENWAFFRVLESWMQSALAGKLQRSGV